jgi:DNA polymerase-3 subunit alpha (Gram-positive type)
MAYNIDFDYKFISIQGRKLGYIFDMKQIDAMYLARAFVPGLKNFKLGSVCKKLGVSLENAHRAVHDATATAEVVIKLNTHMDKL